ncbi:MAG: MFS transporter, partial [Chloroflexi bacterium]|nr:MFS transporter [Chloroflexota bacterium]
MQRSSRGSEAGGTSVITGAPTPGVPRRALPRTIESFKSPTYRLFFGSMMCQMGAMNMQMLARSWLMYELTNSPAWLGFASLAVGLPALCFSFLGGMIADRVQKKRVLIVGQTAFSLISLLLALSITLGIISIERQTGALLLLVSAVAQGTVDAFMNPARQAMIPEIVGRRSLSNAIALNAAGMNVNRLLLPAGAGFLIVLVGVEAVFYLMAFLYIAASLLVLPLPLSATPPLRGESPFTNFVAGLRYIKGSTMLPGLLLLTLVAVLFSMPYQNLLPVFTKDILGVGPGGLGMLVTVSGLGALVGSIVIAASETRRRGLLYLFSILGTGIALLGFSASH